jgi:uncharacterized protein YjbI with pentapeptide repeats
MLNNANLIGSDLTGADLSWSALAEAALMRADLSYANLERADLREANFRGAVLRHTRMAGATLSGAHFRDAQIEGVDFRRANLIAANLSVGFTDCRFSGAIFNTYPERFQTCWPAGFNPTAAGMIEIGPNADLRTADLSSMWLCRARLGGARMSSANLCGAMMCAADLSEADLQFADLRNCNLRNATLAGANMEHARFEGALLRGAKYDETTSWPAGFVPEVDGATMDTTDPRSYKGSEVHLNLREHRWKTTLIHLRRHFVGQCEPSAILYNGFADAASPRYTPEGERIWAIYAVGIECIPIWWQAQFTGTRIEIRGNSTGAYAIPYTNIAGTSLPPKSVLPTLEGCRGGVFYAQRAFILGHDGEQYEVRAGLNQRGMRDVYLWHVLTAALRDQARHAEETQEQEG